jgi:competence protein ComEA
MTTSWLDRNRGVLFSVLSVVAIGGATMFYLRQPASEPIEIVASAVATVTAEATATPPLPTPTPAPVRVYVTGAVVKSDVYFLPAGSIIKDAIAAAGGLSPEADPERINQALELKDQQQIHIPRLGETNPPPPVQGGSDKGEATEKTGSGAPDSATGSINLNTATLEQLDSLPGIGPAIAQRIIDYREKVGNFSRIEDITEVSGIGEATFAKIKDLIVVE